MRFDGDALRWIRPELLAMEVPVHGGTPAGGAGPAGDGSAPALDFSTNLNFFLPGFSWADQWPAASLERYPDPASTALRRTLAASLKVPEQAVWAGNGACELISSLSLACLRPGDPVLVFTPTFAEYERASRVAHGMIATVAADEQSGWEWSPHVVETALARVKPRLVWLCNPNNPTGLYLRRRWLEPLMDAADALWVLDESYLPFVEDPDDWTDRALQGRVVLVRSLTKQFSVPGLRLGYLVAAPPVVQAVRLVQPCWSVSAPAQQLGAWLVRQPWPWPDILSRLRDARQGLVGMLADLGLVVAPSAANFLLVRVGRATDVARDLARRGVVVRDATSFGLPAWIRVTVRRPAENRRLVEALRACLAGC